MGLLNYSVDNKYLLGIVGPLRIRIKIPEFSVVEIQWLLGHEVSEWIPINKERDISAFHIFGDILEQIASIGDCKKEILNNVR